MTNLLEIREYRFEGCTILVKLDKRNKTISFVEWSQARGEYVDKEWIFADRKLEYMNGWENILTAMEYAIEDCKKTMETWEQEETDKLINILEAMEDSNK